MPSEGKWRVGGFCRTSASLTPQQYEVAVWVGRGFSDAEISVRIGVLIEEVKKRVRSAIQIKGCNDRGDLEDMFAPDWDLIDGGEPEKPKRGRPKKRK